MIYLKNIRYILLVTLLKLKKDDSYSNILLNNVIKSENLSKRDAAFFSAMFYGILEKKLFLEHIIKKYSKISIKKISYPVKYILYMGLYQIIFMDKVPNNASVNESVNLCKKVREYKASGYVNGLLRSFLRNNCETYLDELKKNKSKYLSVKYSVSEWIVDLLLNGYKEIDVEDILKAFSGRPAINVRVNNLKCDVSYLKDRFLKEGIISKSNDIIENCLEISNTSSIDRLDSYKKGLFHVENLASQICCKVLDPKEGQTIVDVCAAPGGKSFTIAELMLNKGIIYSHDIYEAKVNLIKSGALRLGIEIIDASVRDAKTLPSKTNFADRVLCDVPCSGLGVMGRKPEIRYKDKELFENLNELQYKILCSSEKMLKPGGVLVYSTCTLSPKENNEVVNRFLKEHKNFEPFDIEIENLKRNDFEPKNQVTLFPGVHGTDGFFICKFRKLR